ncbi:WD40 repeat-like protein [Clavulina sp. PMI_390]|nr:WD40 repeat-like protein [Clavulina sp. PMI_390]
MASSGGAIYPITCLTSLKDRLIFVSGAKLYSWSLSRNVEELSANESRPTSQYIGAISHVAVDLSEKYMVSAGIEDKQLKVWRVEDMRMLSSREIPKKATGVLLTADQTTIIVSDKFGDVFSYPLEFDPSSIKPKQKLDPVVRRESVIAHGNQLGELLLGHASRVTSMLLTPQDESIITADRDEHIRVSHYPDGFDIESYCLGHSKFVSALALIPSGPLTLVSGGGDPDLYFWDWKTGALKLKIRIFDHVISHMVVSGTKLRHDARRKAVQEFRDRQFKKEQNRLKNNNKSSLADVATDDVAIEPELEPDQDTEVVITATEREYEKNYWKNAHSAEAHEDEPIAVSKLVYVVTSDGHQMIMWSILGATALFYTPISPTLSSTSEVVSIDLCIPVIDFVFHSSPSDTLIISCDPNHSLAVNPDAQTAQRVFVRQWTGFAFEQVRVEHTATWNLQKVLNDIQLPATVAQIEALELYDGLMTLPKHTDEQEDDWEGDDLPPRVASPHVGDKRGNTGERADKRKKLKETLATMKDATASATGTDLPADPDSSAIDVESTMTSTEPISPS